MPSSSGEDESGAPESARKGVELDQNYIWEIVVGIIIPVTAAAAIHFLQRSDADSNTSFRLHALHLTTQMLQGTARMVGSWALATERAYNEVASTLH